MAPISNKHHCSNTTYFLFYLDKVIQIFMNSTLLNFGLKHYSQNFQFRYIEDGEAHFQVSMYQKALQSSIVLDRNSGWKQVTETWPCLCTVQYSACIQCGFLYLEIIECFMSMTDLLQSCFFSLRKTDTHFPSEQVALLIFYTALQPIMRVLHD